MDPVLSNKATTTDTRLDVEDGRWTVGMWPSIWSVEAIGRPTPTDSHACVAVKDDHNDTKAAHPGGTSGDVAPPPRLQGFGTDSSIPWKVVEREVTLGLELMYAPAVLCPMLPSVPAIVRAWHW